MRRQTRGRLFEYEYTLAIVNTEKNKSNCTAEMHCVDVLFLYVCNAPWNCVNLLQIFFFAFNLFVFFSAQFICFLFVICVLSSSIIFILPHKMLIVNLWLIRFVVVSVSAAIVAVAITSQARVPLCF